MIKQKLDVLIVNDPDSLNNLLLLDHILIDV